MDQQLELTFILIVIYQVKHYIADFPLQREYMLRKAKPNWDFAMPLALHCAVHSVGTLVVCLIFAPSVWWIAVADFIIHFVADRIKSGPRYLGRFNDLSKPGFWNVLGFDQMVHHLTHLYFIYIIVMNA
jgi:hypothetical protein